ncbi:MAG: suppressor of fused domain protein [Jatrophihabitantaceae bacterium]
MSSVENLAAVDDALAEHFGHRPVRASMSFVGVHPIEILRFEPIPGERAYVSLGMSAQPMTAATETIQSADDPRAELMVYLRDEIDAFAQLWRQLAVLAASPAVEGVVYRVGMTVDLGTPLAQNSRCTGGVLVESAVAAVPTLAGPVEILQLLPATSTELGWGRVRGSVALRQRWAERDTDLLDLARAAVDLT